MKTYLAGLTFPTGISADVTNDRLNIPIQLSSIINNKTKEKCPNI
jgi:hypothetical protein